MCEGSEDIASESSENRNFLTPHSHLTPPLQRTPGEEYGEEIMIVGRTMWTQSTSVTDRQTYGLTYRITIIKTVQTASHGKNAGRPIGLRSSRYTSYIRRAPLNAPAGSILS